MAGYMMGRLMGGGMAQQQPLFSSKNPAARPTVSTLTPAARAMVPPAGPHHERAENCDGAEAATTTTVTRGGFGESVAKQSTMQRSAAGSTSSSRSMGG